MFPYALLNREARALALTIQSQNWQLPKSYISRDRIIAAFALMTDREFNAGALLKSAMRRFRLYKGFR